MMSSFTWKQIILIGGFIIILISIPLTFYMIKQTQIFNSHAAGPSITPFPQTNTATQSATEVPQTSPLQDLQTLLNSTPSAQTPTPTVADSISTPTPAIPSFGPTLSGKVTFEGRVGSQSQPVFLGIASGQARTKPTYILTLSITTDSSGSFSNISLAGLTIGDVYTAYIKGPAQIDIASTFTVLPGDTALNNGQPLNLISGDLNEDNTINSADYTVALNAYGTSSGQPNFNSRADINGDGVVNSLDLSFISKNMGQTGASGVWYSTAPTPIPTASPSALLISPPPIGGFPRPTWNHFPGNNENY